MVIDALSIAVLGAAAVASAFVGSVAGSGGAAIMMPVTVMYFGVHQAIPIITIANLFANLSRVVLYRKELDLKVVGWVSLGSLPLAVLGAWLFTVTAPEVLIRFLGGALIVLVVWRRISPMPPAMRKAAMFLPVSAVWGFLSGFAAGMGPLMAPFYLAYGLMKGAYIGTDALATVLMQATKVAVYGGTDFLQTTIVVAGLAMIPCMVLGTWLGKKVLDRMPESAFAILVEIMLLMAGLNFLLQG